MFTVKNDEGITLIETLLAVLLFSIISAIVATFFINSYKNIAWFRERISGESQLMLFQKAMSSETAKIKLPYWTIPEEYKYENDKIFIPWYNGDQDNTLEIIQEEELIKVKTPQASFTFNELSITDIKHKLDDDNNVLEISVKYRDEIVLFLFRFSGFGVNTE